MENVVLSLLCEIVRSSPSVALAHAMNPSTFFHELHQTKDVNGGVGGSSTSIAMFNTVFSGTIPAKLFHYLGLVDGHDFPRLSC